MKLRIISESLSSGELRRAISEIEIFLEQDLDTLENGLYGVLGGTFVFEVQITNNTTHIKIKRGNKRGN